MMKTNGFWVMNLFVSPIRFKSKFLALFPVMIAD